MFFMVCSEICEKCNPFMLWDNINPLWLRCSPVYLGILLLPCSSAFAQLSWQVLAELGRGKNSWLWPFPVILRDFPFPLQAFPTRKGPDFFSDWCSERNLPSSLQQLLRAAPAAPEPAGSGDRAQGTAQPCSLLRAWKIFHFVVCLVATGHSQPGIGALEEICVL